MATREQLLNALKNAHAAGDTRGAQRLAAMIQALPKDAAPVAPVDATPQPMATREQLLTAFRNAHAAGDVRGAERISAMIQALPTEAAPQASPAEPRTEDYLRANPDWIAASRIIFDMGNGSRRFQSETGAPEELSDHDVAEYGLDEIGWFNTNLLQMGTKAHAILGATDEQKRAMLFLMDNSEGLGWSWEGSGRLFRGIATDPTTYVGFGSLGLGTVAAQGGKVLSREGLKVALRAAVNMGARGAVEGAVYGGVANIGQQTIRIQGGAQEGVDVGQLAQSTAAGAALGFGLGAVVGGAAHGVQNHIANGKIAEAEALFGTGPPVEVHRVNPAGSAAAPDAPQATAMAPEPVHAANENGANIDPATPRAANENAPAVTPSASPDLSAKLPDGVIPANTNPVATNANMDGLVGPALGVQTHLSAIMEAITTVAPSGAIRVAGGVQGVKALTAATHGISQMIEQASRLGDGASLGDALLRSTITAPQLQVLKHSAQQANDGLLREIVRVTEAAKATTNKAEGIALRERVDFLEQTRGAVQNLDSELATQSGRDLRMRQEGLNAAEVRGLSVKSLMEDGSLSRKEAENALLHHVKRREAVLANKVELAALDQKIKIATEAKDYLQASALKAQRETILGRVDSQLAADGSPMGRLYAKLNKGVSGVLEVVIANVFSPSTVIINTVPAFAKIAAKPFANYLAKGVASPTALREMLASYTALHSMSGAAFKAGLLAFKYEKSLLLHNSERAFFGSGAWPKRYGGGIVRFFPRLLNASDEFLAQIAYRSYGIGTATANALSDAATQGLQGHAADDFVSKAVKDATDRLYTADPTTDANIVDMLLAQAQERGLGGEKANKWVRNELNKHGGLLRQAESQSGKDYVKDLLFKREFSGVSPASKLAKDYEQFVQNNPLMKVMGQLFFRTPIRVFEEGVRITPGLNLVTPGFLKDLAGGNGTARQIKAQGEAMMSYGVFGSVMALYASGSITGGGPSDFRQRRQGENAGFEPYTITFPNGDKWSYRNLDPIATPLKIIVNALDRISVLQYREAQGETPDQSELDKAMAYAGAGVGAIAQSFQDANLTQGVDNVVGFVQSLNDPRSGSMGDQGIKAIAGFLAMAVPSTWTKARMEFGGEAFQNDPITLEQVLRAKINPQDPLVPRQYTAVGAPRTLSNAEAGLLVFNPSTAGERERGKPLGERELEQELWTLAQVADTDFTAPYRSALLPSVSDLRKVNTRDGKETLYDRWQSYVHDSDVVAQLSRVLASSLPYGTPGDSPRATAVKAILSSYREAAMLRLIREEVGGLQGMQDAQIRRMIQSQSSNTNVPFN